jgi:hypothetical protein
MTWSSHIPPVQGIFGPLALVLEEVAYQSVELLSIKEVVLNSPVLDAREEMAELYRYMIK